MRQWEKEGKRETFHQGQVKPKREVHPLGTRYHRAGVYVGVFVEGGEDSLCNFSQFLFDKVGV